MQNRSSRSNSSVFFSKLSSSIAFRLAYELEQNKTDSPESILYGVMHAEEMLDGYARKPKKRNIQISKGIETRNHPQTNLPHATDIFAIVHELQKIYDQSKESFAKQKENQVSCKQYENLNEKEGFLFYEKLLEKVIKYDKGTQGRNSLRKMTLNNWRIEFIRIAIIFGDCIKKRFPKDYILPDQDFMAQMKGKIKQIYREYKKKKREALSRRKKATKREKERRRILGLAIDEFLRNPEIKPNTAAKNAWNLWIKKPKKKLVSQEEAEEEAEEEEKEEEKYGESPERCNLKRRYFPHGITNDEIFVFVRDEIRGSNREKLQGMRKNPFVNFRDNPVSRCFAEKLYESTVKMREQIQESLF